MADFLVTYPDGRRELIEVKGHATREWLIKEKLCRALYPDLALRVVQR